MAEGLARGNRAIRVIRFEGRTSRLRRDSIYRGIVLSIIDVVRRGAYRV